jgi:hypothetical protein
MVHPSAEQDPQSHICKSRPGRGKQDKPRHQKTEMQTLTEIRLDNEKAREDKTRNRQDKTRQDKTTQHTTTHDNTRPEKTRNADADANTHANTHTDEDKTG